jgi:cysteine synthase B
LTPSKDGIEGSRDYAQKKVDQGGYKMLDQFSNPDNFLAHYNSTGP